MKGKIIIVFTLIFISLGVMWAVNRLAFEKITSVVKDLSMPNEKLSISRKLFINVSNLPHLQQTEVIKGKDKPSASFTNSIREISENIDTLRRFLQDEPSQLSRIDSIATLLRLDNRLFLDYLQLRYQIEQKKVFERQLSELSAKMDTQKVKIDSNVVTSEQRIKTTTIIPPDTIETAAETPQKKRSWIKRIFSKADEKEADPAPVQTQPQVIVQEEVKSRIDTLLIAKTDTALPKLGASLRKIESRRVEKLNQLVVSEEDLSKANNVLIHKLLNILDEVEKQEIEQVKKKTSMTVLLAGETINRTRLITILFIVIAMIFGILMLTDVTRSRKYRKQLEAAKAEAEYHSMSKQRFLANMSHEIRTPLQSIIGYSEQQLNDARYNDENTKAVYNSSKHLLQIVNEVLDYSRITSGKFSFESTVFSISKVVAEVFSGLKLLADAKSLQLTFDITRPGEIENVKGDPFRLKQVLFNLVNNAIKFTEKGSVQLTVGATRNDDTVILSIAVEDTGIGMSEEEVKQIFNQFEQVGNSADKARYGTGLGLSIVKELVEAQQGSVTVQSEPGKGSRFEVSIPFVFTNELPADSPPKLVIDKTAFKGKVWLVDDDPLILRLSSMILSRHHIEHHCFNTAEKLLDEPWDNEVKIVFADMRLPGINGAELCVLLRRKIPADTRIIALTAQVLPEEKESILESGFNELLLKPFTEAELVDVVYKQAKTKPVSTDFDFRMLEKMVGNRQEVNSVLKQCHNDTSNDIDELSHAVQQNNAAETSLIIHRLAGRVGQLGDRKLAKSLRQSEVAIRRDNEVEGLGNEIDHIFTELNNFLKALENEMETA